MEVGAGCRSLVIKESSARETLSVFVRPLMFCTFCRCLPSGLLRAELERRNYNFLAPQVELFVEHQVNRCCEVFDAVVQVARWQVQKVQADARKRAAAATERGSNESHTHASHSRTATQEHGGCK